MFWTRIWLWYANHSQHNSSKAPGETARDSALLLRLFLNTCYVLGFHFSLSYKKNMWNTELWWNSTKKFVRNDDQELWATLCAVLSLPEMFQPLWLGNYTFPVDLLWKMSLGPFYVNPHSTFWCTKGALLKNYLGIFNSLDEWRVKRGLSMFNFSKLIIGNFYIFPIWEISLFSFYTVGLYIA